MARRFLLFSVLLGISICSFAQLTPGTYTINPNGTGDYISFNAAVNDLKSQGIGGPVTFEVAPGTYNEQVEIPAITGVNQTNTITFDGQDTSQAKLTFTATSNTNAHTLMLDNASYITVKNLTIENDGTSEGIAVLIYQQCSNITIQDNLLQLSGNAVTSTSNDYKGISINGVKDADDRYFQGSNSNVSNITIKGNKIKNPSYGIHCYGGSSTGEINVEDNVVENVYQVGFSFNRTRGVLVDGNYVKMRSSAGTGVGIYLYNANAISAHSNQLLNNRLDVRRTGIHIATSSNSSANPGEIANNEIYGMTSSSSYGIYATFPRYYNVHFNSILMNVTTNNPQNSCIYFNGGGSQNVTNNNLVYGASSGQGLPFNQPDQNAISSMDYNNFYNAASSNLLTIGGSYTSNNYQGGGGFNSNSTNQDPLFVANDSLKPQNICILGQYMNNFSTDRAGASRNNPPVVGALTSTGGLSTDLEVSEITKPTFPLSSGDNDVYVLITNKGTSSVTAASISVDVGGTVETVSFSGSLNSCESDTVKFEGNQQLTFGTGTNSLEAYINSVNGSSDLNQNNDTLKVDFCTPISGTFTIDPSGSGANNYNSVAEAVDAINCGGISGPVTFNLVSGTFTDFITLDKIKGVSSSDTIVFAGAGVSNTTLNIPASGFDYNVRINGTDHVTIKDMKLVNTRFSDAAIIWLSGGSDSCRILNNELEFTSTSSGQNTHITLSSVISSNVGRNEASHTLVRNNTMTNGYYGIRINSDQSDRAFNNRFESNTFNNIYYYGIYERYTDSSSYIDNEFNMRQNYDFSIGVYIQYSNRTNFQRNVVRDAGRYGVYLFFNNRGTQYESNFINNMIGGGFGDYRFGIYAVYMYFTENVNFYHNSVYQDDQSTSFSNYYITPLYLYYAEDNDFQNNIIVYDGSTNTQTAAVVERNSSNNFFDYNQFSSTTNYYYDYTGNLFNSLQGWQSFEPNDNGNSVQASVQFVSNTDLHLTQNYEPIAGTPLGIDIDIDGDSRCSYKVSMGADEGNVVSIPPNAAFIHPDSVFINSPVNFVAVPRKGTEEQYEWYLNDQLQTTNDTFNTTFTSNSTDTVILVAINCGGSDTDTFAFDVKNPLAAPQTDFVADRYIVSIGDTVYLDDNSNNGPTSFNWSISDPNHFFVKNANTEREAVVFTAGGSYEVCLTTSNNQGSDQKCKTAFIDVRESVDMCFDSKSSATAGILWDDLGPFDGYSPNVNCNFLIEACQSTIDLSLIKFDLENGDYLRIYDGADATGTPLWDTDKYGMDGITGNLDDANFDSAFTASSGRVYVEFKTNSNINGDGFGLAWESRGGSASFTPAVANFDVADTVCRGVEVVFENLSTGNANRYEWYDGRTGIPTDGFNFSTTYNNNGSYDVELDVYGCNGKDSIIKTIVVEDPPSVPEAFFYADNLKPLVNRDVVTLYDTSTVCADQFAWSIRPTTFDFVNGTDASSRVPQVIFKEEICYTVELVIANPNGFDAATKSCYIQPFGYCTPKVAALDPNVGILSFNLGEISNNTQVSIDGFTDYSLDIQTTVVRGEPNPFVLERASVSNTNESRIWIDYNKDGDFDDAGELVMSNVSADLQWVDTFAVPTSQALGLTRMRIANGLSSDLNEVCGPNSSGEYEDYGIIIRPDEEKPVITLNGADTLSIERCNTKVNLDLSANGFDNADGNITDQIVRTGSIDTSTVGDYNLVYKLTDQAGNEADSVVRVVRVLEDATNPMLSLNGDLNDTIAVFNSYTEAGFTATDNCSGIDTVIISSNLDTAMLGLYTISYTAIDSAGNESNALSRTITVIDTVSPEIIYTGNDTIKIEVFTTLAQPKFTISDNYQDEFFSLDTTGDFYQNFNDGNPDMLGVYSLNYIIKDGSGNADTLNLHINVVDETRPEISLIGDASDTVMRWMSYDDPGVDVSDNYSDVSALQIDTAGNFETTTVEGIFFRTYLVTDENGNQSATITRIINVVENTTGLNEEEGTLVTIYPNPTYSQVNVAYENAENARIEVYTINGQKLMTTELNQPNGTEQLSLIDLAAGNYIVRLISDNYVKQEKITLIK